MSILNKILFGKDEEKQNFRYNVGKKILAKTTMPSEEEVKQESAEKGE